MRRKIACMAPRVQQAPARAMRTIGTKQDHHGLYNYRWQQARIDFLRKHPLCIMCAADQIVTVATVVDHKQPHQGDMKLFWDEANWQPLCKSHHDGEKQRQEREAGLR